MAKKKPSHHSKDAQPKQQPTAEPSPQLPLNRQDSDSAAAPEVAVAAMDDSSEKLESLKAFNARLLKETFEGRRQIEALVQEKKSLEAELTRATEEGARSEVEKSVVRAFVESEVGKMEGLEREKSELLEKLVRVSEERDLLKSGLVETEKRERLVREEESEKLKLKCEELVVEKEEREALVDDLKKEKSSAARDLAELKRSVKGLKSENESVLKVKSKLEVKIGALEKELEVESATASGLRSELEAMRARVSELENYIGERMGAMEAEKERRIKELEAKLGEAEKKWERSSAEAEEKELRIKELVQEKRKIESVKVGLESEIVRVSNEVGEVREALFNSKSLLRDQEESNRKLVLEVGDYMDALERASCERDEALGSLNEERKNVEELKLVVSEKEKRVEEITKQLRVLRDENESQEKEIFRLSNEVGELREALYELQSSCRDQEESNMKLVSEVDGYKAALERVALERDEARKAFDGERKKVEALESVVSDKEKRVEQISKELRVLRDANESLVEQTKGIESQLSSLMKENDSAQKSLLKAENRIEEWRAKVGSAGVISERALTMLKKTAAKVSAAQPEHGKKEAVQKAQKLEDEIQPYVAELEAIHSAFSNKQKIVEELKQQVEALQRSADEANRRKSFWTIVSSATTIFAAASVAYVAKAQR